MDEILETAVRIGAGVATLVGVLWAAMRYMTRYYVERSEQRMKNRLDNLEERAKGRLNETDATVEKVVITLDAHIHNQHSKLEARVSRIERTVNEIKGGKS
ncbi:MAG TPA: hypothetical protein H9774_11750 [Candidatus Desulfovibrio gallistercoris]|nr:hypothetical protein [Candidatus Desulfovibrio gallistercoris]